MSKDISCVYEPGDTVKCQYTSWADNDVGLEMRSVGHDSLFVFLDVKGIRALRKQLKKALKKIEQHPLADPK